MKKVWTLMVLALALCLMGGAAWAQSRALQVLRAQEWQANSDLPGAILDSFPVYNGAATLRKLAIGFGFMGAGDDTIKIAVTQSAGGRRIRVLTDTSTAGFGLFRMDSCAYQLPSGGTATALAIGDINGNGYTDILTATTVTPFKVFWFEWDSGLGSYEVRDSLTVNAAVNDIVIGDANNDGNANEILFNIAQTSPSSAIMRAVWTAPGTIDTTRILLTGAVATRGIAIGNVRSDLAGNEVYVAGGSLLWMVRWDGAAWTSAQIVTGLTAAYDVAVGDIDPTLPGNEIAVVHGSTSYQISLTNWTGAAWAARLWALSATWGTADNDIAIGDFMSDNPGNEVVLTPGGAFAPRAFWISPVGGAWTRTMLMGAASANYGVAIGNVNRFRTLNQEVLLTGMGGRVVENEQRVNATDLGTQAYRMTNGAFAKQGVADNVEVMIFNAGSSPVSGFSVDFRYKTSVLTGSAAVAGPLATGDTMTVQVPMPAYDFTGFDTLYVYTTAAGDANPFNDTTKLHIEPNATGDSAVVWSGFNTSAFAPANATFNPVSPRANEWKATILTGSYNWRRVTSGTNPTIANLEGAGMASFPCYSATAGSSARLRTNAVAIGGSPRKVKIKFYMYHDTGYTTTYDSVYVQYSFDDITWSTAAGFQRYNAVAGWQAHDVEIGDFPAGNTIYVGLLGLSKYGNNIFVDSVRAYTTTPTAPMTDAGVSAIANPGLVAPGQPFTVTATIRNYGLNNLTSTGVYYTLGGADTVRETWTGNLGINQTVQHSFATQLALPDSGNYTLYAGTELAGDENPANDVSSRAVRAYGIYALPYVQDFNDATWLPNDCDTLRYASGATIAGVWTRETAGTYPTCSPYEGAAMAKFNSYNAQAGNQVMFISPRVKTGYANAVGLSFAFYGDPGYSSNGDSILIDITTDDGATWTRGVAGFWRYAPTAGWRYYNVNLGALGNDTVQVALRAKSAYGNNMFVDDVHIYDQPPTITYTSPSDGATGVLVNAPVRIGFSEPINTSSFTYTCAPDPGNWIVAWNAGNDTVTLTHDNFATSTLYTFTVTAANDMNGNPLVPGGPDNPFSFTTSADGTPPTASVVTPAWGATGVALNEPIVLAFSEPMNTGSIDGYTDPFHDFTPSWNATGDTFTLTPQYPYSYSTTLSVILTAGTDLAGYSVVGLPDTVAQFTTMANEGPSILVVEQPGDTYDGTGPFLVRAVITDPAKAGITNTWIQWQASNSTTWTQANGTAGLADTFDFAINGPFANGLVINAYVGAVDDQADTSYSNLIQFRILQTLPPTNLTALAGDMMVQLNWAPPAESLYYYQGGSVYYDDLPATCIVSSRYTPKHHPFKVEAVRSSWNTGVGNAPVHFRIMGDDGNGFPDEGTVLIDTTYTVGTGSWGDYLNLSDKNIVVGSGDIHVTWEILTSSQPRPRLNIPDVQQRGLIKWTDGNWYLEGGVWLNRLFVSYSSYLKNGVALKSARINRNSPILSRMNHVTKPTADNDTKQAANLPAFAMLRNISGYEVFRGDAPGGPYGTSLGTLAATTLLDMTVTNGQTYYYVVRANYSTPDTFSAFSNEATATPAGLPILLVDDDGQVVGSTTWIDGQPYYTAALDGAGYTGQYSVFEKEWGVDGPAAAWYQGRDAVIWFTSYNWNGTLTDNDFANLASYLDAGGRLFLCGQDIIYDTGLNTFTQNYLGVQAANEDVVTANVNLAGLAGSLAEGYSYALSNTAAVPELYGDDLTAIGGAGYVFDVTAKVGEKPAIQYDNGTFRTVFFAFPFENLVDGANTKAELMYRILNWLNTGVEGNPATEAKPTVFSLANNYPNPVRTSTTIKFGLPKDSDVRIEVFNIAGQRVKTLAGGKLNAGYHQITWKGANDNGQKVAAGVYLVRMVTPEFTGTRKMTVIR